jgi:magnesium-transporting ATPase (P-type)
MSEPEQRFILLCLQLLTFFHEFCASVISMVLLEESDEGIVKIVEHEVTGSSYNPTGSVEGIDRDESRLPDGAVKYSCDIMTLCNDARLIGNDSDISDESIPQYSIEGEPTEAALAVLVEKLGPCKTDDPSVMPSVLANQNNLYFSKKWERYGTLEFDRKRKSMSVLCMEKEEAAETCSLFVKGAPSMVLKRCSHAKLRNGKIVVLSNELVQQIEKAIGSIGDRALRCIGLAYKSEQHLEPQLLRKNHQYDAYLKDSGKFEAIENGMTFVGMVAIKVSVCLFH